MKPQWVKIAIAVVGLVFAVGVAWALVQADIRANSTAIQINRQDIGCLEEADKDTDSRLNETEVLLRGIQTDVEWIRGTLDREYGHD